MIKLRRYSKAESPNATGASSSTARFTIAGGGAAAAGTLEDEADGVGMAGTRRNPNGVATCQVGAGFAVTDFGENSGDAFCGATGGA